MTYDKHALYQSQNSLLEEQPAPIPVPLGTLNDNLEEQGYYADASRNLQIFRLIKKKKDVSSIERKFSKNPSIQLAKALYHKMSSIQIEDPNWAPNNYGNVENSISKYKAYLDEHLGSLQKLFITKSPEEFSI